jgi:Tfp pilus assembly protein PilO
MKNIGNNIKILTLPLAMLITVLILGIFSLKVFVDSFSNLNQQLSDNKKMENVLQEKLNSLKKIDPQIDTDSQTIIRVLPPTNSVLNTISSVRANSVLLGLNLSNIRSDNILTIPNTSLKARELDFDANGNFTNLVSLVENLKNSMPIARFQSFQIINQGSSSDNIYRMTASLFSYWAPLPTNIPSIDQPIVELNKDEQTILSEVTVVQQPTSSNLNAAPNSSEVGKVNPFQ